MSDMLPGTNTIFDPLRPPGDLPPPGELDPYLPDGPGDDYGTQVPDEQSVPLNVYIETEPDSGEFELADRIRCTDVQRGMDGDDTTCTLTSGLDVDDLAGAGTIGTRHLTHLIDQLRGDRRVRIMEPRGASAGIIHFQGFPLSNTPTWSPQGESVTVTCHCEGQERLARGLWQQIGGRRMRFDPLSEWDANDRDDVLVFSLPPVFNAGGRPNRSSGAYPFPTDNLTAGVHLFTEDGATGAEYWRYIDALRYVVMMAIMKSEDRPPVNARDFMTQTEELVELGEAPDDPNPLIRLATGRMDELSVQALNAREALTLLCDHARLHFEIAVRNIGSSDSPEADHRLRVFAVPRTEEERDAAEGAGAMTPPAVHDAPREAPFTALTDRTPADIAAANAAVQSTLTVDPRTINRPIYQAGPKSYEITVLLRPLWLPHAQLDNLSTEEAQQEAWTYWLAEFDTDVDPESHEPATIYLPQHPLFHTVRAVGRLWGFPDGQGYMRADNPTQSDYARDLFPAHHYSAFSPDDANSLMYAHPTLGAGIAEAADWVPRMRPFRETIARRTPSSTREPIVWVNYNATNPETALAQSGWEPVPGGVVIDEQRATVWIAAENLMADTGLRRQPEVEYFDDLDNYLLALIEGRLMVAVTCTVVGDFRMHNAPTPVSTGRLRHQIVDLGHQEFQFRDRTHNVFADRFATEDDPEFVERDDSERMGRYVERDAEHKRRITIAGSLEIPWLDDSYRVGDAISGVAGLGIEFDAYPSINRIQFTAAPGGGHRTILHLTDMRHAPELADVEGAA